MAPDVADAAAAEGVDLIRPMVDPASRSDYGALESNIYSQPIIRGAAGRVRGQIEDRVSHLARTGVALEPNAAGDVIQGAGNRFITKSRNIKNRLYDRADNLGGTTAVKTTEAQGQIDQELSQLAEAPETNGAEIGFLQNLKSDLSQPQTVGSIRRIRTSLRGQINNANLTATTAEARAMRVLDAAKNDIQRDAPPAAASAYARADAFNRERQTHIDTVLRDFLGKRDQPLDSEKAFFRLKALVAVPRTSRFRRRCSFLRPASSAQRPAKPSLVRMGLSRSKTCVCSLASWRKPKRTSTAHARPPCSSGRASVVPRGPSSLGLRVSAVRRPQEASVGAWRGLPWPVLQWAPVRPARFFPPAQWSILGFPAGWLNRLLPQPQRKPRKRPVSLA
jgi:hypothetical protein